MILISYYNRGTSLDPQWEVYGWINTIDSQLLHGPYTQKRLALTKAQDEAKKYHCGIYLGIGNIILKDQK